MTVPDLDVSLPALDQVGFVVRDLADGAERFRSVLGVGPWAVWEFEPPALTERTYRGDPARFTMRIAIATVGDLMLELIEPVDGPSIHRDFLDDHGEGLHHIACFSFEDTDQVVEAMADAGAPVVQRGRFGESTFVYLDTTDLLNGVLFETGTAPDAVPEPDGQL
ncbi:VOC family protein [Haloglomus litoreum]|uniref:VOC family protein n=1 Tax=Haloglomus litoreum TaxID=3034026 RepID=UPI0023E8543C|nr:VOC family protein [Haloglomus sp. DT116]